MKLQIAAILIILAGFGVIALEETSATKQQMLIGYQKADLIAKQTEVAYWQDGNGRTSQLLRQCYDNGGAPKALPYDNDGTPIPTTIIDPDPVGYPVTPIPIGVKP